MRADIHSDDKISFDVEDNSQVCFNFRGVNDAAIASRQLVDFMLEQARIEWILFENREDFSRALLLLGRHFPEATPERPRRGEAIFHLSPGYGFVSAVSKSTKRPVSASAIPSLNDSGIHESSFSTTNLATCARSFGGRALICSMISVTLRTKQ